MEVVIDFETTGLCPFTCEPIQICMMVLEGGENKIWYIDTEKPPEEWAEWPRNNMEKNIPQWKTMKKPMADVMEEIFKWIGPHKMLTFIAHNAPFDYAFWKQMLFKTKMKEPGRWYWHDTASIQRQLALRTQLLPYNHKKKVSFKTINLKGACEKYDIKNEQAHNALGDVLATAELFKKQTTKFIVGTNGRLKVKKEPK